MINLNELVIVFGVYAMVGIFLSIVHHFIKTSEEGIAPVQS